MRIDLVTIVVDDYDVAIDFFVDALGFELVADAPAVADDGAPKRWVVVRPSGEGAALLLAQADDDVQRARVGSQTGTRVGFFLAVDDVASAHRRMAEHGVRFVEAPRDEPYGTVAVFEDVAGNRWDLIERR